jgi:hypothetical protein
VPSLKAISLTSSVLDWLANSRQPRILHIFAQACNLINERKEVVSVVTPQIGNGPFNLVIDHEASFSKVLDTESVILISSNRLMLGNLTIDLSDATTWFPRPAWEILHTKRELVFRTLISCVDLWTEQAALAPADKILPILMLSNFSSALVKADISATRALTSQLAGLGIGLTPSGDDFIMGAIYATWIIHSPETAKLLAHDIASAGASLTTSLSAAWLRSAGRGEAGIAWHRFFDALVSANTTNVESAIGKILNIGATSGADALAGFIGTFQVWAGLQNPNIS